MGGLMNAWIYGWLNETWVFILSPVKAAAVLFKEDFYTVWETFSIDFTHVIQNISAILYLLPTIHSLHCEVLHP